MKNPFNIIYDGIGSCDRDGNAKYLIVLPTGLNYNFGDVYDFTKTSNTLLIFMSVNNSTSDVDLSDYNGRMHDPKEVQFVTCEFSFNNIKKIPGETYPGYDRNEEEFKVIVFHDDENDIQGAADIFFRNTFVNDSGKTKKLIDMNVPKTSGFGTLKKFKI